MYCFMPYANDPQSGEGSNIMVGEQGAFHLLDGCIVNIGDRSKLMSNGTVYMESQSILTTGQGTTVVTGNGSTLEVLRGAQLELGSGAQLILGKHSLFAVEIGENYKIKDQHTFVVPEGVTCSVTTHIDCIRK